MLKTERLYLRPWRDSDREPFAAMNADTHVRKFFPSLLSREESDASILFYQELYKRDGFGLLAAELRETQAFVGFIGIQTMSFPVPAISGLAVEIGWRLAHEVWGRGLATEGARAVLQFALEELQLPEVVAITVPANLPSRRIMEKRGMSHDPQDDFDHPGLPAGHSLRRHVLYRIREEYSSSVKHAWHNARSNIKSTQNYSLH